MQHQYFQKLELQESDMSLGKSKVKQGQFIEFI